MATILCIDDNDLNRETVVDLLQGAGFETFEASDGRSGLRSLLHLHPDLVICDLHMPDMSGLDVLRKWREQREGDSTPFILLSGIADRDDVLASKRLGADDYLAKPIDPEILVQTVRTRLQNLARAQVDRADIPSYRAKKQNGESLEGAVDGRQKPAVAETNGVFLRQHLNGIVNSMAIGRNDPMSIMLVGIDDEIVGHEFGSDESEAKWHAGVEQRIRETVDRFFGAIPGHRPYFVCTVRDREFAVVLEDIDDRTAAGCVAREILRDLGTRLPLPGGSSRRLSARIGIVWVPDREVPAGEMVRRAAMALQRCRVERTESIEYYDESWAKAWFRKEELSQDLRGALRNHQFTLEYQPRVSLNERRVESVEALIRWQHPSRGRIPPDQFIPAVEQYGLTVAVGEWVIGAACAQAHAWQKEGRNDVKIAVNIAPIHFGQPFFAPRLSEFLRRADIDGQMIEIEITESLLLADIKQANANLAELKGMGITVALDDFGTGFSNLSYLQNFPADTLKIDRSFVWNVPEDPLNSAIAKSIVDLARLTGMRVVVEGIERKSQLDFLRGMGCDEFQGYYFSRPVAPEKLPEAFSAVSSRCQELLLPV